MAAGRRPEPRFLRTGLWRFSRHPNFFFEQAQWWIFVLFAVSAAGTVLVWTWLGAFLLTLLFIGSTIFTESISRSRYPEYADYQHTTSMLIRSRRVRSEAPPNASNRFAGTPAPARFRSRRRLPCGGG